MASAQRERLAAAVVLALAAATVYLLFAPGRLNFDTLFQINEVATGDLTNQHAPVLQAIWKPFWEIGVGPEGVLLAQLAAFLAGGWLVLRTVLGRVGAAVAIALIALAPPVLFMLGTVIRDTWFAALLLLTTGLAIRAVGSIGRTRAAWLIATGIAAWLTVASRQNAGPALAPILAVLLYILWPAAGSTARRAAVATGAGVLAVAVMAGSQFLASAAIGVRDVDPEQYLYVYDLGALSVEEGESLFPADTLAENRYDELEAAWDEENVLSVTSGDDPVIAPPLSAEQVGSLRDSWQDALTGDPRGYVEERTELFAEQLSIGADPALVSEAESGYAPTFPSLRDAADDLLSPFVVENAGPVGRDLDGGILFTVWPYLLVAIAAAFVLLRRATPPALLLVGALALSALTLQLGLYPLAMGIAYRFEFPAVVAGLVGGRGGGGGAASQRSSRDGYQRGWVSGAPAALTLARVSVGRSTASRQWTRRTVSPCRSSRAWRSRSSARASGSVCQASLSISTTRRAAGQRRSGKIAAAFDDELLVHIGTSEPSLEDQVEDVALRVAAGRGGVGEDAAEDGCASSTLAASTALPSWRIVTVPKPRARRTARRRPRSPSTVARSSSVRAAEVTGIASMRERSSSGSQPVRWMRMPRCERLPPATTVTSGIRSIRSTNPQSSAAE